MRSLAELLAPDSAWPIVQSWIASAKNAVEVLPVDQDSARRALTSTQVTTRSPMGAVIYNSGGLLVDGGWVRVLGSGSPRLPRSLPEWNVGRSWLDSSKAPPFLLVADDVIGGSFAVNGGALGQTPGNVFYFAPDALRWEDLGRDYSGFLVWLFTTDLGEFYATSRWQGWRDDVAKLPGDSGFSIYPFLWAKGPPVDSRSRRPIPFAELYGFAMDARRQLGGAG